MDPHAHCNGPQVWLKDRAKPMVSDEPTWQTIDHLQAAKTGPASYTGEYDAVWAGAIAGGRYAPPSSPRLQLCDDLARLLHLEDARPQLALTFAEARYVCAERRTEVALKLTLAYDVRRWRGAPHMPVTRYGTVRCVEHHAGSSVRWGAPERWFAGATTRLGFTLEVDSSPLRTPFVYIEWKCGDTTVLMLFKKRQRGQQCSTLTREERARLGIGMTHQEFEVAHILSLFQTKGVVFSGKTLPVNPTGSPHG